MDSHSVDIGWEIGDQVRHGPITFALNFHHLPAIRWVPATAMVLGVSPNLSLQDLSCVFHEIVFVLVEGKEPVLKLVPPSHTPTTHHSPPHKSRFWKRWTWSQTQDQTRALSPQPNSTPNRWGELFIGMWWVSNGWRWRVGVGRNSWFISHLFGTFHGWGRHLLHGPFPVLLHQILVNCWGGRGQWQEPDLAPKTIPLSTYGPVICGVKNRWFLSEFSVH